MGWCYVVSELGHKHGHIFSPATRDTRDGSCCCLQERKHPCLLESVHDKWGPSAGTSGKVLPVSHCVLRWEPWLAIRKAHSNTPSHISWESKLWEGVHGCVMALWNHQCLMSQHRPWENMLITTEQRGLPGVPGAAGEKDKWGPSLLNNTLRA